MLLPTPNEAQKILEDRRQKGKLKDGSVVQEQGAFFLFDPPSHLVRHRHARRFGHGGR